MANRKRARGVDVDQPINVEQYDVSALYREYIKALAALKELTKEHEALIAAHETLKQDVVRCRRTILGQNQMIQNWATAMPEDTMDQRIDKAIFLGHSIPMIPVPAHLTGEQHFEAQVDRAMDAVLH